ncbi:MAG: hypothetical protein IJ588_13030 [Prevotella sp.]|nr:hypothetical protein [Prevotella sp.]
MKHLIYITTLLLLSFLTACSTDDEITVPSSSYTYRMVLNASFSNYDGESTRANDSGYGFRQGDQVHVLFALANSSVAGTAVYDASTGSWEIPTSQALAATDDGSCRLAFFLDDGGTSQNAVVLTQQTRIYTDTEATYQLVDGLLNVQATLSPALGRVRFHGEVGQKCTVSGLSFASSFNLATHTFALSPSKFTATCDAEGYTSYYYAAFTEPDNRELTFVLTAESGLRRQFPADVLLPGSSGYVNIPTSESHEGWTLVNLNGGGEINFPAVSAPVVTSVGSNRFSVSAAVTSDGGGKISAVGFVVSTSHNPTRSNRDVECTVGSNFSGQVNGLSEQTVYYIRAYAVNEAGTTYSDELVITTKSKTEDSSDIDYKDWDNDENWNDAQGSEADVDYVPWPADENWN